MLKNVTPVIKNPSLEIFITVYFVLHQTFVRFVFKLILIYNILNFLKKQEMMKNGNPLLKEKIKKISHKTYHNLFLIHLFQKLKIKNSKNKTLIVTIQINLIPIILIHKSKDSVLLEQIYKKRKMEKHFCAEICLTL